MAVLVGRAVNSSWRNVIPCSKVRVDTTQHTQQVSAHHLQKARYLIKHSCTPSITAELLAEVTSCAELWSPHLGIQVLLVGGRLGQELQYEVHALTHLLSKQALRVLERGHKRGLTACRLCLCRCLRPA